MALHVAQAGEFWSKDRLELNLSFENLKDFQWERLVQALWQHPSVEGPYEQPFIPTQPAPPLSAVKVPQPTDSFALWGSIRPQAGVQVGMEVQMTRSLFECLSIAIPLGMFAADSPSGVQESVEQFFYNFALELYETTTFSIATLGINRGCQLMLEMLTNARLLRDFLAAGNFLAAEDTLISLRVPPARYLEARPHLRWCPPNPTPST